MESEPFTAKRCSLKSLFPVPPLQMNSCKCGALCLGNCQASQNEKNNSDVSGSNMMMAAAKDNKSAAEMILKPQMQVHQLHEESKSSQSKQRKHQNQQQISQAMQQP